MGPILQRDTRPKLSLEPFLSLLVEERPTPIAIIKGTVMGPVVTPPESNATEIKSEGATKDSRNNAIYKMKSNRESCNLKRIRRTATTRKAPTPRATVQIRVSFGIEGT